MALGSMGIHTRLHMYGGLSTSPKMALAGMATVALGLGSIVGKKLYNTAMQGTEFTNPMFNNITGQAYGKRGIDANNLNTNGLVQSLHSNRRRPM